MWNTGNLVLIIASPSTPVTCKEEPNEVSRMKNQQTGKDLITGKHRPPSVQNQNHNRLLQTDKKGVIMILEELTRLSSNLFNTLSMISPLAFATESTQSDPQSIDEDPEVKRSVHVLDKLIAMAKQCQKALNPFACQSDCKKLSDWRALHNQQLHVELSSYSYKDIATNSPNSMSGDHSLASFKDSMQAVHQQYLENVNHDRSVEKENQYLSEHMPKLEPHETGRREARFGRYLDHEAIVEVTDFHDTSEGFWKSGGSEQAVCLDIQSSKQVGHDRKGSMQETEIWYPCEGFEDMVLEDWSANELDCEASTEELEADEEFKEAELQKDLLLDIQSTENADDNASGEESGPSMCESQEADALNLQHSEHIHQEASLEKVEYSHGFQYPPQSLTQLQIHKINSSKMEAVAPELDHETSECGFWSPSETLQELEKTAFFQTQLSREVEYEVSVEETELPYPSDLFEEIHSNGIPREQALKWDLVLPMKPKCQSSDLEALEDPEIGLIPKTDPWKQADFTTLIEDLECWKEIQFHDMGCTGLENSTGQLTLELQHNALGSFKDLEVYDVGFTGLQLSGKACTQLSLVEEVRKTLHEYAQESLKELEVHDICFVRQKILEADFKPLMEELVDSFAEYPSASSSPNENSPEPSEFSEVHQSMLSATENTTHKPLDQAKSVYSCAPFLLPRMSSSDTETLEELVEQNQASLKSAIGLDSQQLRIQAPELDSNESSPVYTYPNTSHDDDSSDSDGPFKQPQWSSRVVIDWDLQSLKVQTLKPNSMNSMHYFETSAELLGGPSGSEFVHEPLDDSERSKMQTLELSTSKDPEEQYHDVAFSELPNFQQVDMWKPLVEEDGVGSLDQTDLEFLFPAHFKYKIPVSSKEDDKKESVLTHSAKVLETPTSNPKAAFNSQELEPSLSFRKGGLKKVTGVTELSRSKRTVTFADETLSDEDEDRFFPSLKSWEIEDEEPQLPVSSKHCKQQPEAEKAPRFHETSIPQSLNDRSSKKKSTSSDSFSSKTGVMQNMISSFSGRLFTHPRSLLASKAKESRSRIRRSNSWMPPKETNFGGSARADAQQIKAILRASHKTFAGLTTSDFLSQELE